MSDNTADAGTGVSAGRVGRAKQSDMNDRDPDIARHEGTTMRRRLLAWLVMCNPASVAVGIGLVLSLAGAYAVSQWEERVTMVEFEGVAETQSIIMQNGMNEYISRLVALRTLF